jgi:hypothetical protein
MTQYVYRFGGGVSDGDETVRGNKNILGGKGANLDGMASIGLPVPPGFTITKPWLSATTSAARVRVAGSTKLAARLAPSRHGNSFMDWLLCESARV